MLLTSKNFVFPILRRKKKITPANGGGGLANFTRNNYIVPSFKLAKSKYRITIRAPKLWNIILNIEEKLIENRTIFKATIATKLVLLENAIVYFWCIYKIIKSLTQEFFE